MDAVKGRLPGAEAVRRSSRATRLITGYPSVAGPTHSSRNPHRDPRMERTPAYTHHFKPDEELLCRCSVHDIPTRQPTLIAWQCLRHQNLLGQIATPISSGANRISPSISQNRLLDCRASSHRRGNKSFHRQPPRCASSKGHAPRYRSERSDRQDGHARVRRRLLPRYTDSTTTNDDELDANVKPQRRQRGRRAEAQHRMPPAADHHSTTPSGSRTATEGHGGELDESGPPSISNHPSISTRLDEQQRSVADCERR